MKVKEGKEAAVFKQMDDWDKGRKTKITGYLGTFMLMSEKNTDEVLGVAIFTSKTAYFKNAKDPEQDKWFKKLRANLKEDPEWNDGEYVRAEYSGPASHKVTLH